MAVLFVDDEKQVLRGLERMLDAAEVEWECAFANSGAEALQRLAEGNDIDTVVTDMKMPGMDGAELLQKISETYPHVVRIVLSGEADKESIFRAVSPMHQYLSKPCDAENLKTTIHRATELRNMLHSDSLAKVVGSISKLPSVPSVYKQVIEELHKEDSTTSGIGEIISQDVSMTAKILQLTNSSVFGLRNPVKSVGQAATLLGAEMIKSLVLTAGVFSEFDGIEPTGFSIEAMMTHSLEVAHLSRKIAIAETLNKEATDEAFTAGVLHDIGKLILISADAAGFSESIRKSEVDEISSWQAELDIFGADHAAIGAHMLSIWGIPQSIIEPVAFHHTPSKAGESSFSVLTAVSSSNEFAQRNVTNNQRQQEFRNYLTETGCLQNMSSWKQFCHEHQG